jgi:RNA polymerase sigma-70 factor (ECF subfamily)
MHPDDGEAVLRARDGDEEAFRLLVERHSRPLHRLAFRMTGRPADAEDVVQETFIRAFRQLDRFEARSNFATWLYRIGYNCAIDHLRGRPRRESAEPPEVLEAQMSDPHGLAADDLVYATEIDRRVQAALEGLTGEERAAFLLRHYDGCSIGEICDALDLKASAAKHAVFRGVRKMREALRPLMTRPAGAAPPPLTEAAATARAPIAVGHTVVRRVMRRT